MSCLIIKENFDGRALLPITPRPDWVLGMEDGATSRFYYITVEVTNRENICEGKPKTFQKARSDSRRPKEQAGIEIPTPCLHNKFLPKSNNLSGMSAQRNRGNRSKSVSIDFDSPSRLGINLLPCSVYLLWELCHNLPMLIFRPLGKCEILTIYVASRDTTFCPVEISTW